MSHAAESPIGRHPDELSLRERLAVAGKWAAFELYSPQTLPLRKIEALGASAAECIAQLITRGLNPEQFEFEILERPYTGQ